VRFQICKAEKRKARGVQIDRQQECRPWHAKVQCCLLTSGPGEPSGQKNRSHSLEVCEKLADVAGKVEARLFGDRVSRREKAAIDAARPVRTRAGLGMISMWSAAFTRERSKVRSLVRPPERSIKSDTFSKAPSGVHFPVHSVCGWSHDVAQNRSGSNSKKPNRNDGTKHGQAGNRPARHVNRTVGLRCVHHRVMPMGHISLLKASSSEACPRT